MELKDYISITEGFPKEGISFKDISPILADGKAYAFCIEKLAESAAEFKPDIILGPEARGFVVGCPLALKMGLGFVMARKKGKLPGELYEASYGLEYGVDILTIEKTAIKPGQRVLIVDDLMATGGTAAALVRLVKEIGAIPCGVLTVIELTSFQGDKEFAPVPFKALVQYEK